MKNLRIIDSNLYKIDRGIRILPQLVPHNFLREKKKFFKSDFDYNPQFYYKKSKSDFGREKQYLNSLTLASKDGGLEKLFKDKIKELKKQIKLIESVGREDFRERSTALYGKPSKFLINFAKSKLQDFRKIRYLKNPETINSGEIAERLRKKLLENGLMNWKVKTVKRLASRISVRNEIAMLSIRKDALLTRKELDCLVAHEVYTHIFRKENGKRQPIKLLWQGTANHVDTEEGLAIYNERLANKKTYSPYHDFRLFIRVLAVAWASKYSFKRVFIRLLSLGLDTESCWDTALRVKRGFSDTSKPGAFAKDYIYLKGYLDIKNFIKAGGEVKKLYIGKIGLNDLACLENISLARPKLLPKWL